MSGRVGGYLVVELVAIGAGGRWESLALGLRNHAPWARRFEDGTYPSSNPAGHLLQINGHRLVVSLNFAITRGSHDLAHLDVSAQLEQGWEVGPSHAVT